jgi:hypothetical protein
MKRARPIPLLFVAWSLGVSAMPPASAPGAGAQAGPQAAPDLRAMHAEVEQAPRIAPVKVGRAKGPNAQTVAGIAAGTPKLKNKPVAIRCQVVKYSPGIMGEDWLHLRDGTGRAPAATAPTTWSW